MADLASGAENTIDKVLTFIVVLALLGGTIGLVFTNLNTLVDAFQQFTSNNTVLQAIVVIFGLVIGVFVVLGIVKLVRKSLDL